MSIQSSYRPHNPGHDYYGEGVYLITLVVTCRQPILSTLGNDPHNPSLVLSQVGTIVAEEWAKTAQIQQGRGRKVETLCQVCMPDHWHGVIVVKERMDKSLGYIIQCFKSSCTARWRREVTGYADSASSSNRIRSMSVKKRAAYYATQPLIARPLFDDDYDDTICFPRSIDVAEHERHKAAMIHYVEDNPRRAIVMRLRPDFFQRRLHIIMRGKDKQGQDIERHYAAFGNLYLLRWARKVQVMCHRKARFGMLTADEKATHHLNYTAVPDYVTQIPYELTEAFRLQHADVMAKVMAGGTVVVTPGISAGEKAIKNECLGQGIPLIHIQKEPIRALWKPEAERFAACQRGTLLILAPWHADVMGEVDGFAQDSLYSIFHNLNDVARDVCEWSGDARVVG